MHSLLGYDKFQALRENDVRPRNLDLEGHTADVNRLNARVRVAKSFKGIDLEEYNEVTALAYGSIFRVFLAYTAFEVFYALFDLPPYRCYEAFKAHPYDQVNMTIRNCDPDWTFTDALINGTEAEPLRFALMAFKDGSRHNPINHASAIRHIFAHGHLSAHTGSSNPNNVRMICDALAGLILGLMDAEFDRQVTPMYADYLAKGVII